MSNLYLSMLDRMGVDGVARAWRFHRAGRGDLTFLSFGLNACNPRVTTSRNSRARRARASIPAGSVGAGISGAEMFSQQSGMSRPVKATGCRSR